MITEIDEQLKGLKVFIDKYRICLSVIYFHALNGGAVGYYSCFALSLDVLPVHAWVFSGVLQFPPIIQTHVRCQLC